MIQATSPRSVLYIDADPVCHIGFRHLIGKTNEFQLSQSTTRFSDCLLASPVDLIVLEIATVRSKGIASIREVKNRHSRVPLLVLSSYNESVYAERCLKAGASGFLMKTAALEEILNALRIVAAGELYVSDNVKALMVDRLARPGSAGQQADFNCLSDRELLIVEQIGLSKNNKEIAQALQISVKTIESHRSRIKAKLRLDNPQELMRYAMRMHLA